MFIIAEIGKNFIQTKDDKSIEEYLDNAKKLIMAAKEAGANAVKFQTHVLEDEFVNVDVVSPHFVSLDRYNWIKRNEEATPIEFWQELKHFSDQLGITFFSTPMSRAAAQKLEKINVPFWKVGSGDVLDFVLLEFLASTGKSIIISSGMSTLKEIDKVVKFLRDRKCDFSLMHCVSKYPADPSELNLRTIEFFKKRYKIPVGFSDHSLGYDSVLAAIELGAEIIEKHFSFSRDLWGADHRVSMTPAEFKIMVDAVKMKEKSKIKEFGRAAKFLNHDEAIFRPIFRKSLVAGKDIAAGTLLSSKMIYAMRPMEYIGGIPSEYLDVVVGKTIKRDLKKYDVFQWGDVKNAKKKKICFVITSKIHYSRNKLLLEKLRDSEEVELQIVVGAAAILDKYGDVSKLLEEDGFDVNSKITMTLEGGSPVAMAKTTGIGITEFATVFDNLKPDLVIIRGDRYEMLSVAIAAAYLNIAIVHIEGGDVSGTIDESVRHAITKLAHVHFATNNDSLNRLIRMGENSVFCFDVGSLDVEYVAMHNYNLDPEKIRNKGVGANVDIDKEFIIVMQHPVTTEIGENEKNVIETIEAVKDLNVSVIWFWPNVDAGTDEISGALRRYRERFNLDNNVKIIKYLPPEEFIALLKKASCLVGNSSAGIKECSYLGVPVVDIGTRQRGRRMGSHIINVLNNRQEIFAAIKKQLKHGRYKRDDFFYKKNTSGKIVDILLDIKPDIQKKFKE